MYQLVNALTKDIT